MRWAIKTQSDYRVSAKTHPIVIIELVGYQWALSEASVQYGPLRTLVNTNFEHMGLSIDPCR